MKIRLKKFKIVKSTNDTAIKLIKNNFSEQNEFLAVVNESGLWIKEEIDETVNIIHAKKFKENLIEKVTITQTNSNFKMPSTIIADQANISQKL